MMISRTLAAALALPVFVACQRGPSSRGSTADAPSGHREPLTSAPASVDPREVSEQMDSRVPVPLLPVMANHQKQNMRDHLLAVQEIVLASAKGDFAEIENAVGRIGFSEQMGRMCSHMGAGAPGFTEQALAFHHTADSIGAAARRRDRVGVMRALGTTLQACTACHATFKQQVVDGAKWSAIVGMAAPSGHHPPAR